MTLTPDLAFWWWAVIAPVVLIVGLQVWTLVLVWRIWKATRAGLR